MKSLFVAIKAFILLFPAFTGSDGSHLLNQNGVHVSTKIVDSIVMEDDLMMLTATSSSNGNISLIEVRTQSGTLVSTYPGCSASSCRTDVSSLNDGTYNIEVTTSTGFDFSGTVTITR